MSFNKEGKYLVAFAMFAFQRMLSVCQSPRVSNTLVASSRICSTLLLSSGSGPGI